jgi:mono/diheme cytochrome c family protein
MRLVLITLAPMILILAAAGSPALAAPSVQPPKATTIAAGHTIAVDVCSACHVVADKQPYDPLLQQKTPSFREVANDPKSNAASLRRFITTTHWDEKTIPMTMPRQMLTGGETDQVVAYILSLKTR